MQEATKICPHCKSEINAQAKKCPQCQSDLRNWFVRHPLITLIIATPFAIGVIHGIVESANKPAVQRPQPASTAPVVAPTFDVPALMGKNIDQIRQVLGKPDDKDLEPTALQKQVGIKEWSNSFSKDGKGLLVTYNSNTRKVIDFFIDTTGISPSGTTTDTQALMKVGNLITGDPRYSLEFVKAFKDPSTFTGVKAIPK